MPAFNFGFQDLLENLTLNLCAAKPTLDEVARRKFRGHRQMSQIVVETYSHFHCIMNSNGGGEKSAEKSKETSPMPTCRDASSSSSKRSTKDSTPASTGEVDQVIMTNSILDHPTIFKEQRKCTVSV